MCSQAAPEREGARALDAGRSALRARGVRRRRERLRAQGGGRRRGRRRGARGRRRASATSTRRSARGSSRPRPRRARRRRRTRSRSASARCCACSRSATRTRRSRRCSSSRCARPRRTGRTSCRSSGSRPAPSSSATPLPRASWTSTNRAADLDPDRRNGRSCRARDRPRNGARRALRSSARVRRVALVSASSSAAAAGFMDRRDRSLAGRPSARAPPGARGWHRAGMFLGIRSVPSVPRPPRRSSTWDTCGARTPLGRSRSSAVDDRALVRRTASESASPTRIVRDPRAP